ncbi:hypothetical protein GCM10010428_33610 [Actinosynnema pretiosum subsp. pretiosum]
MGHARAERGHPATRRAREVAPVSLVAPFAASVVAVADPLPDVHLSVLSAALVVQSALWHGALLRVRSTWLFVQLAVILGGFAGTHVASTNHAPAMVADPLPWTVPMLDLVAAVGVVALLAAFEDALVTGGLRAWHALADRVRTWLAALVRAVRCRVDAVAPRLDAPAPRDVVREVLLRSCAARRGPPLPA